jgi:ribosomal-protein-alanine N-acetyltransferase
MPLEVPAIRTERLSLEPLREHHAMAFLAYYQRNRAYLQRWEPLRDETFYTEEHQRSEIAKTEADAKRGSCARFIAFEPRSDAIVASFNLWNIRRGVIHAAIVGYSVDERRAARGYATEILQAIVRYAFGTLGLHRIETSYQPDNRASGRVLHKNGFIVEGYARDYLFLNGAWRDGVLVSLTNDAWLPAQAP